MSWDTHLKRQQQVVVSSFVSGNDVFVALPTDSSPADAVLR